MKKFIISTIAAAALTAGMAGAASTASAAMPTLGAQIQTTSPAAKDGAVQIAKFRKFRRFNFKRHQLSYGCYIKRERVQLPNGRWVIVNRKVCNGPAQLAPRR